MTTIKYEKSWSINSLRILFVRLTPPPARVPLNGCLNKPSGGVLNQLVSRSQDRANYLSEFIRVEKICLSVDTFTY